MKRIAASNYQKFLRKKQKTKFSKLRKTEQRERSEFTFKTCQIAAGLENLINLGELVGLKNKLLCTMCNFSRHFLSEIFALGNCSAIVQTVKSLDIILI